MLDLLKPPTEGLEVRDASSSAPKARSDSKHALVEAQSIAVRLPSVVTDAAGDTLAKDTKSKKGIIGSPQREIHNVFTHYPKDSNCEVCKKTKTTRARCRIKPEMRVDGIAPSTQFGDLITADHKILNVENKSSCGHKNSLVVQDVFMNWILGHPMRTKEQ